MPRTHRHFPGRYPLSNRYFVNRSRWLLSIKLTFSFQSISFISLIEFCFNYVYQQLSLAGLLNFVFNYTASISAIIVNLMKSYL